jgi:cell division protease FtsH
MPSANNDDIEVETEIDVEDISVDEKSPVSPKLIKGRARVPASKTLAANVLKYAFTPAQKRQLRRSGSFALVIEAPGPAWVEPLKSAIEEYGPWALVCARDGTDRRQHRPDKGNDEIAHSLANGKRCVGIAPLPQANLPAALLGAADLYVKVTPTNKAIADSIVSATGRRPADLPPGFCTGLDLYDIAAGIRVGDRADMSVARLRAAVASRSVVDSEVASAPLFTDLHGYGEARDWGDELLADLDAWRAGKIAFNAISSRVVLASAPGLGKTTFVRSLAKAAGLPLIATSVSFWFSTTDGHLNSVIKAVDEVFSAARALGQCIVFIDEIDAIPNRATLDARNRDYWLPIVTHILLLLDSAVSGMTSRTIVIGCSNHPEHIDAALMRPGRLDKFLHIGPPDSKAREGILRAHMDGALASVDLNPVAQLGSGMTGADLADTVKKARRAARVAGREMEVADLAAAIAPADTRSPQDRRLAAVHEAGHTVAQVALGAAVDSVSIVERGDSGGATVVGGLGGVPTRDQIEDYVVALLSGRAAEQVILGSASTGAGGSTGSDLARAAMMIASIHASYGLGDSLQWRSPPADAGRLANLDPTLRAQIDVDLKRLFARAMKLVESHRPAIEAIAERLLKVRYLSGDDIQRVVAKAERAAMPSTKGPIGGLR